ncbi:hypothetical protein SAMN04488005_0456 [Yoonia tamlensis]|uniref:Uncharacterized protein n=1 Tax=Yoonia tamlensis TaxID=390270 RepID=A0A1I6FTH0_9RHOB|nr:hypothetical protein SAMN04488005_0456 [Yoonia tamlensis]
MFKGVRLKAIVRGVLMRQSMALSVLVQVLFTSQRLNLWVSRTLPLLYSTL